MLTDVLLTHSNHLFQDPKQVQKMQPYPPLQTMLVAAVLRQAGLKVAICDTTFEDPRRAFMRALREHAPRYMAVCEDSFNFLTKMCLTRNRELAFWMAKAARERGIPVAVHGSDASDHPLDYQRSGFDRVLRGAAEPAVLEWTTGRTPEITMASLPDAARDLVDLEPYRAAWQAAHGYFSLNVASSRGCPYRCNWCAKPIWGDTYQARTPQSVAREMLHLKRDLRAEHVWFADDIFALSHQWTLEFADAVESLDAAIPFKMQSRCDLMTRDSVGALARAGCVEVWMGAESGSQRILDAMDKGLRRESIYEARENLRRHGIRACFFIQFGYPGEGWEEIQETVRMVRDTRPDDIGVSVSYPLPGTRFYQLVAGQLEGKANWRDSGDLAMMFRGAYSSDFYRALADALHVEVRRPESTAELCEAWNRVGELRTAGRAVEVAL